MRRNTYVKDIDGRDIYEGDIVGIYTWGVQAIADDKELAAKAAGEYKVVFKYEAFKLEEIKPSWFHNPYNSPVSDFRILKVIRNGN